MSRARERREAARMKRQVPEPDDDSEQFEWMDVEAEASTLLQHSSQSVTQRHYRSGDKLKPVR